MRLHMDVETPTENKTAEFLFRESKFYKKRKKVRN